MYHYLIIWEPRIEGEESRGYVSFSADFANPLSKGDDVFIRRGGGGDVHLGKAQEVHQVGGKKRRSHRSKSVQG